MENGNLGISRITNTFNKSNYLLLLVAQLASHPMFNIQALIRIADRVARVNYDIDFSSLHAFKHGIKELDFSMFLCLY